VFSVFSVADLGTSVAATFIVEDKNMFDALRKSLERRFAMILAARSSVDLGRREFPRNPRHSAYSGGKPRAHFPQKSARDGSSNCSYT
jgi:hypothetical protein